MLAAGIKRLSYYASLDTVTRYPKVPFFPLLDALSNTSPHSRLPFH